MIIIASHKHVYEIHERDDGSLYAKCRWSRFSHDSRAKMDVLEELCEVVPKHAFSDIRRPAQTHDCRVYSAEADRDCIIVKAREVHWDKLPVEVSTWPLAQDVLAHFRDHHLPHPLRL